MKAHNQSARNADRRTLSRRRFLKHSAVAGAGVLGCPAILRGAAPNSQLQVACIGVGGMGGSTMKSVASHSKVKIVALCDVDERALEAAAKAYPDASRHKDWRELLSKHADKFDAVTIGTPDHMHAAPAVTALRAKKHLYLQKPMAATLHECRIITQEAAQAGVVTQLGNQGRSSIESRMTVELIRSGAIGKIKEVILWENKPLNWWPKNTALRTHGDAVPAGLDWDLWLGVRQPRPYLADTYHPKNWRAWFDFGVGEMGDMGCHHFDTSFDALKLTAPLRVRQTTAGSSGPLWGDKRIVEMIFKGSDVTAADTVQLTWHDGGMQPDRSKIDLPRGVNELPASGTYWIGEAGAIFKKYGAARPVVLPETSFPAEKYPAHLEPQDHYHDWVDAIIEGRQACDDFKHGGPLTEAVLVGAMADRASGEWLEWDRQLQKFTNSAPATALVRRPYRDGWQVRGLG
ncbi:MAG: Gfo/Idh/MocA family oxidoreductase [Planctomycetaceae bacterium]|nr:Gfo/Idh/MocA family oxidoreductase [Planctomycetaceae bacterium]